MCWGKTGKALKFSIFDRSVALPERRRRLPLPVAISLDVSCYSHNLPIFIFRPIASSECRCVIKVWQTGENKNPDVLRRLRSNPAVRVLEKSRKRTSKSLCTGGLSIHFLFKTLEMDEMRYWAHRDVEWHPACWLWNVPACEKRADFFHLTNQCKAPNQRSVFLALI